MRKWFGAGAGRPVLYAIVSLLCTSAPLAGQPQEGAPATGRIIHIEPASPPGKLRVKQKKSEKPADATIGMTVRRGYLLTLDAMAKATVVCADGKRHDLIPGPQGCPCTTAEGNVIYEGSTIPRTRGHDTAQGGFPIVISPRKTLLLSTRPTIRWSPVTATAGGAPVTYRITIFTEGMKPVWRKEGISATQLVYPAEAEELKRGEDYQVVIQAGTASSEQEHNADLGFTILTAAEVKSLSDAEADIRTQNLPEGEKQFLIANLYAARGLSSEAIEKLIMLSSTLKVPAVLRMLGDLYAAAGLHREAVEQYEAALTLPQIESDVEGQALTLAALGQSLQALRDPAAATSRFRLAVEAFRKLGETVTVEQLRNDRR